MRSLFVILLASQIFLLGCRAQSQTSASASQQNSSSSEDARIKVGIEPSALLMTDLNGDGKLDLAVANYGSRNVSVLLGDGKGSFTESKGSPFPAGDNPNDIAAADVNKDGHVDLAFANHDTKYVTILLGDGRGSFLPAPSSPVTVNSRPHPHGIAFGDFNGDGNLDFVVDDWVNNRVTVLFGDGHGGFSSPGVSFDVGRMPYKRVRVADFNRDGRADIVTTNTESGDVSVLLSDGKGSFNPATGSPFKVNPKPFAVAIGDLNKDGILDLALAHFSGHITDASSDGITLLWGAGDGTFKPAPVSWIKAGAAPTSLSIGDMNGDGVSDVAVANYGSDNITIIQGNFKGMTHAVIATLPAGHKPEDIASGDLNGDGKADIVVANSESNDVTLILSK